ncbi:hypothetical protein [Bacillus cereus]|uniref:hypothetical protein n=1 Tax=Bacillus cereus TaxID=1396 RepID=UPI000BF82469|nr:hypothetical protein [Bacillus cereus]PFA06620.1 hypothetical protein CN382_25775 [Bacillus cereus]
MRNEELNILAIEARNEENAMWEVKAHYMGHIEGLAQDNWYKMNNEADFIEDCYRRIEYAVRSFNEELGDFSVRVYALLQQGLRHYCGNRGGKRKVLQLVGEELDAVANTNIEEDVICALVEEEEVYAKYCEREIDKLIVDIVLHSDHLVNKSDIARRLAKKTGRTFNSARGAVRSLVRRKRVAS